MHMAAQFTLVRFLWNAARATGAARAAARAGTKFELGKNIAKLAARLYAGNALLQEVLGDKDFDDLTATQKAEVAQELANQGIAFEADGQTFRCDAGSFQ